MRLTIMLSSVTLKTDIMSKRIRRISLPHVHLLASEDTEVVEITMPPL